MKRAITVVSLVFTALMAVACGQFREIPAGYVGKVLTPTGWQSGILGAGQVDLGVEGTGGSYNVLVLLEATSLTIKEQFAEESSSPDKQDHRVMTIERVPLAVDIYVQVGVPADFSNDENKKLIESIYAQVTPEGTDDKRVRKITLNNIYYRFASMTVRGKTRAIFARYQNDSDVFRNYEKVNDEVAGMVANTFDVGKVPLQLLSAQISNVKIDKEVWKAQSIRASADAQVDAINKVGAALRANPQYQSVLRWDSLKEIARQGAEKGHNVIIVTDGGSSNDSRVYAAAEYTAERVAALQKK